MSYIPVNISIVEAAKLLKARSVPIPEDQILQALRDGQLRASGLVDGIWQELKPAWWRHINSPLDDIVWFDRKSTNPPTPFRAERIEIPREDVERLWPVRSFSLAANVVAATKGGSPPKTSPLPRKRGPKPAKLDLVIGSMKAEIETKKITPDELNEMKEEALASRYNVSRYTVRKARDQVLSEIS